MLRCVVGVIILMFVVDWEGLIAFIILSPFIGYWIFGNRFRADRPDVRPMAPSNEKETLAERLSRQPFDTPNVDKDVSPYMRGKVGEMAIASRLNVLLDERFLFINNLRIPNSKSRTGHTEIDLVCIGPYNVFIIEVKNVSGFIDVSRDDYEWNIHYPHRKAAYTMRNACRQARIQQLVLKQWLNTHHLDGYVIACVVFPNPNAHIVGQEAQLVPIFRCAGTVAGWISATGDDERHTPLNPTAVLKVLLPYQCRDESIAIGDP